MSDIKMDDIVSLSKRRGFIFPGSEIYGGEAGLYDFGPYGVELLNNIKKSWWVRNVQLKEDYVGLDSAMFKNPRVWEASGHVGGFSDPLAECKNCNARIRVDKELAAVGVSADEKMSEAELNKLFDEHRSEIACPTCGKKDFSEVKAFNLLVKSNLGDFTGRDERPVITTKNLIAYSLHDLSRLGEFDLCGIDAQKLAIEYLWQNTESIKNLPEELISRTIQRKYTDEMEYFRGKYSEEIELNPNKRIQSTPEAGLAPIQQLIGEVALASTLPHAA